METLRIDDTAERYHEYELPDLTLPNDPPQPPLEPRFHS